MEKSKLKATWGEGRKFWEKSKENEIIQTNEQRNKIQSNLSNLLMNFSILRILRTNLAIFVDSLVDNKKQKVDLPTKSAAKKIYWRVCNPPPPLVGLSLDRQLPPKVI